MKYITHSVSVSADKAEGYEFVDGIGDGSLENPECEREGYTWVLTGKRLLAEPSDFKDLERIKALGEAVAKDLGLMERDAKDGSARKGEPVSLAYVLNNGGLALAYGDAIKARFRKGGGAFRELGQATAWAAKTKRFELLQNIESEDVQRRLIEAYRASR